MKNTESPAYQDSKVGNFADRYSIFKFGISMLIGRAKDPDSAVLQINILGTVLTYFSEDTSSIWKAIFLNPPIDV